MHKTIALTLALVALPALVAQAQTWGDLTATFIYDGKAPAPKPTDVNKDQQFCGKHGLVDEDLVVNAKNNGIANVVVYLMPAAGAKVSVHPDYAKTANDEVKIENKNCRYSPHVTVMRTTQQLVVGNPDPIGHNSKGDFFANSAFNVLIPAGGETKIPKFVAAEKNMSPLSCSIHNWMNGYLLIKDDPYAAVSDADGKLTIKNLPTGKWTFVVWQEKSGNIDEVKQNGKAVKWTRGRVELDIKAGANNLGEIKIPPSTIDKKLRPKK